MDDNHYARIPRELLDELLDVLRALYSDKRAATPPPALLINRPALSHPRLATDALPAATRPAPAASGHSLASVQCR